MTDATRPPLASAPPAPLRRVPGGAARVHPSAVIDAGAQLGEGASVWHFTHVCSGARLGRGSSLGQGCYVGPDVHIGAFVRVQNNVSVFQGVTVEDEAFLGPGCVFANVKVPRAALDRSGEFSRIWVRRGATIGANATILPGVTLGRHCFVAAGAVVTRTVPDYALAVGAPARVSGFVSRHGGHLVFDSLGHARCPESNWRYERTALGGVRCLDFPDDGLLLELRPDHKTGGAPSGSPES